MPTLYHFCCAHGRRGIGKTGFLLPNMHALILRRLVWLTTQANPDRDLTGLTHHYIGCNRMQYRYLVTDPSRCEPWIGSCARDSLHLHDLRAMEESHDPEHWYISSEPVPVMLAQTGREMMK